MQIKFEKYHGTGNDFVLINNIKKNISPSVALVKYLSNRKFGIGADGVIFINPSDDCDFEADYYNADGTKSFCGNGSRCSVMMAKSHNICGNTTRFSAIDGMHEASIMNDMVNIQMLDVTSVEKGSDYWFINTGSPHYIKYVDDVNAIDFFNEAKKIRYNERFKEKGTNVNFVSYKNNVITMRTYERGVEDETLSCGTGTVAVAISANMLGYVNDNCNIETLGGTLQVSFKKDSNNNFTNIRLSGPAVKVFEGVLSY